METALVFIITAIVATGALMWLRGGTVFLIRFREGTAQVERGRPPPNYARACDEVARLYGIRSGTVRGVRRAGGITLAFSNDIPEAARQPLRNVWTPPPTPPPSGARRRA